GRRRTAPFWERGGRASSYTGIRSRPREGPPKGCHRRGRFRATDAEEGARVQSFVTKSNVADWAARTTTQLRTRSRSKANKAMRGAYGRDKLISNGFRIVSMGSRRPRATWGCARVLREGNRTVRG